MRTAKPRARSSRTSAIVLSAVLAASSLTAAACTGSSSKPAAARGPLETTRLRVGIPNGDIGPLPVYTAVDTGLFKKQGLDVEIDDSFKTYEDALVALAQKKVDVVYDDYAHAILSMSSGAYRLQLVAEGYTAGAGSVILLSKPMAGRNEDNVRAVFNAKQGFLVPSSGAADPASDYTVPTLMLMEQLPEEAFSMKVTKDNADQHLKRMKAKDLVERGTGSPDTEATVFADPYYSEVTTSNQTKKLLDLTTGGTANMPMGGYFANQDFAINDPNTFKAFNAALNDAKTQTSSRATAIQEMQAHYGVLANSTIAANISFGSFPDSVNVNRVSRVLQTLQDFGLALYFNLDAMMPPDAVRGGS